MPALQTSIIQGTEKGALRSRRAWSAAKNNKEYRTGALLGPLQGIGEHPALAVHLLHPFRVGRLAVNGAAISQALHTQNAEPAHQQRILETADKIVLFDNNEKLICAGKREEMFYRLMQQPSLCWRNVKEN